MNKSDIEMNILSIVEPIYNEDKKYFDKFTENDKQIEEFLTYIRFENEKILTEVLCLLKDIDF